MVESKVKINIGTVMYRTEKDALGTIKVHNECYWGAQTQRTLNNFLIGHQVMPLLIIHTFAHHKASCALANTELKKLDKKLCKPILKACEEILKGKFDNQFPLKIWQSGSGTQTNMNVNEVIANRANEILGCELGTKEPIHPNNHVNMGQSSNDNFPTVMHVSTLLALEPLLVGLKNLASSLRQKAKDYNKIISIGRTHLQDATPIRFGQHFDTFAEPIISLYDQLQLVQKDLCFLPQGGTAVGNGLNTHKKFSIEFCRILSQRLHYKFKPLVHKSAAMAHHEIFQRLAGVINNIATTVMKMANDLRLLASGPRCGFGEINLPANEPGSSIMPGKINPTQIETLTMICAHVMGLTTSITIASTHGHLQLNTFKPLIIYNTLETIQLLTEGINSFLLHCLKDLRPNQNHITNHLNNSLMLVTALSPYIGYDKATEIALYAHKHNVTLAQAAIKLQYVNTRDFKKWTNPETMLSPQEK